MSKIFEVSGETFHILGSSGIFLFGMKIMSEAFQKVAGDKMCHISGVTTNNRLKGIPEYSTFFFLGFDSSKNN